MLAMLGVEQLVFIKAQLFDIYLFCLSVCIRIFAKMPYTYYVIVKGCDRGIPLAEIIY